MSELVTDYMEHTAPWRLRLGMWWHLARCDACRHYFDQVRRTVRLLGSGPPRPPSAATEEEVVTVARRQRES